MGRRVLVPLVMFSSAAVAVGAVAFVPEVEAFAKARVANLSQAGQRSPGETKSAPRPAAKSEANAKLVDGATDQLWVPPDVVQALEVETEAVAEAEEARTLSLSGSLALDADRLVNIHSRFEGEVVEIGTITPPVAKDSAEPPQPRPLQFGDEVQKGQLLAVLWSTALGEKKSEYVDTLSKLHVEQETLTKLENLYSQKAIPERTVREARRVVEAAEIDVSRVERTLMSWRLTDEEIEGIKAEAESIRSDHAARDLQRERSWARLEVHSPISGTIVEKNATVGDIVDPSIDLFKVADLKRLAVWAHIYEEDLPDLLSLPSPITWTIRLKSDPRARPMEGQIEEIGDIIDPNQHTALVMGHLDNPDGRLRAGQFIVASVDLPVEPGEMEIPTSALVEDGEESIIFIQPDPEATRYAMVPVEIVRHSGDVTFIKAAPAEPGAATLETGVPVVSSGALELRASLKQLKAAEKASK